MEQLAVIKRPTYGVIDRGYVALRFEAYTNESSAALQILDGEDANALILDAHVKDVSELEGKTCWVEVDGGMIVYQRMFKS